MQCSMMRSTSRRDVHTWCNERLTCTAVVLDEETVVTPRKAVLVQLSPLVCNQALPVSLTAHVDQPVVYVILLPRVAQGFPLRPRQ